MSLSQPTSASVGSSGASRCCAASTAFSSAVSAARWLGSSGFRRGGSAAWIAASHDADATRTASAAQQPLDITAPALPYFSCLLGGQFFDCGQGVVGGQIRLERRDRHVTVADGLIVGP